jgi:hypothetical protein
MWVPETAATSGLTFVDGNIQSGVNTAVSGMTVRVAAGTYAENVTINKPLTLLGANAGVNPNTATRGPETVVTTAVNDPTNDALPVIDVDSGGDQVTIDGFTFDGINPSLGTAIQSSTGVLFNLVAHETYQNNIARNFLHFGVAGVGDNGSATGASGDNLIQDSLFTNMPGQLDYGSGEGVDAANNFYVSVENNVMQGVRRGVQFGNFYKANPGAAAVISGNQIDAGQIGIWMNNFYETADGITIQDNTLTSTFVSAVVSPPNADANRAGLFFSSLTYDGAGNLVTDFTVSDNNIRGEYDQGILFWNNSKSVTVSGGTIDGSAFLNRQVGVRYEDQNPYYGATGAGGSGGVLTLSGVTVKNATTGVQVAATLPAADGVVLPVGFQNGVTISGGTTGLALSGQNAQIAGKTLNDVSFTGQSGNYITLAGGAEAGNIIDATGVGFGGIGGPNPITTLSQFYAIEGKITDYRDDPTLGDVELLPAIPGTLRGDAGVGLTNGTLTVLPAGQPQVTAFIAPGAVARQSVAVDLFFSDPNQPAGSHFALVFWGDSVQAVWLGDGQNGFMQLHHRYSRKNNHRQRITVAVLDAQGHLLTGLNGTPIGLVTLTVNPGRGGHS